MSDPKNILDDFVTYNYHFFLIAANSTEVLRSIENHTIKFSSLAKLSSGETVSGTGTSGSAVMVLNTTVDSKYSVESFNYDCLPITISDPTVQFSQATSLELVVRETGGATFINFLSDISDVILNTSVGSISYLLKIFFVGHRANGSTETIGVNPITVQITKMGSSFDHTGGLHHISLVALSNGAPLATGNTLYVNRNLNLTTTNATPLISSVIKDLEKKLNAALETEWKTAKKAANGYGRKVQYKFTWPKEWDELQYTVRTTSKDNFIERYFTKEKPANQKSTDTAKQPTTQAPSVDKDNFKSYMNTSVKNTVVQILNEILKHSDQIQSDFASNAKLSANERYLAKLHKFVTSITSDLETLTVHFDIVPYYLPIVDDTTPTIEVKTKIATTDSKQKDPYALHFDYMFTGMNTDITNFDMKIDFTNVFVNTNLKGVQSETGNMTASDDSVKTASEDKPQSKDDEKNPVAIKSIRKYDPIYLSDMPVDAQKGFIYAAPDMSKLRQEYINKLALLAASQSSVLKITIRGNPILMNQYVEPLMPHNESEYIKKLDELNASAKAKALLCNTSDRTKIFTNEYDPKKYVNYFGDATRYMPVFVKVNIMMPARSGIGYEPFWYRGRYRIVKIGNKFNNGVFEQELELIPTDDLTGTTA